MLSYKIYFKTSEFRCGDQGTLRYENIPELAPAITAQLGPRKHLKSRALQPQLKAKS